MQAAPNAASRFAPSRSYSGPATKETSGEGGEEGQHPDPGLERRVAELLLHELGQVEQRGEEGRRHEEDRQAGGAEALVAHHRRAGPGRSAPARRSIGTKAAIRTPTIASRPITFGSPQPQSSTWSSAISSETRPTESAAMPA